MEPVIEFDGVRVFHGDCRDVLAALPDNSVHSVVTDPPYGLGFMGKEWDSFAGKSGMSDEVRARQQEKWGTKFGASAKPAKPTDGEMLAFQVWCTEWAVECLRVLKPGGHLLAFGGTRTWHRLAVAVEDAGFEVRDSIAWMYGSGFPKSLNIGKSIEAKILTGSGSPSGQRRAAMGDDYAPTPLAGTPGYGVTGNFVEKDTGGAELDLTTPEAQKWQGWGTALKPAFEPIVVARKPLSGTVAETVLEWGTGGLNIDGSRIGSRENAPQSRPAQTKAEGWGMGGEGKEGWSTTQGRWPANVILDEVTAGLLDEQSGVLKSGAVDQSRITAENRIYGALPKNRSKVFGASEGGASRFFYCAKASKRDRNEGLEDLEAQRHADRVTDDGVGGDNPRNRTNQAKQNFHPTVKPTALMRYMVKLVTPPGGTVLDPFTGSGSTGKAAILEGFDFVGVELTDDYLPIIEGRLKWALENQDEGTLF